MAERVAIASGALSAAIDPFGAELSSLRDAQGREWMTDADPAFWSGRAPLLFPIVGRLHEDRYRFDGREYPLPQHGFARRQPFALIERASDRAIFRLEDNAETRKIYPLAFTLDAAFSVRGATLTTTATVTNRDQRPMPASFGYHPAFAWPLPGGGDRRAHRIVFEREEPATLAALAGGGWIAEERRDSPVEGRTLRLDEALFAHDALVWDQLESRSLRYEGEGGVRLEVAFDAPMLGLWTKPGARFLCIEPWWGLADPIGFEGRLVDKPHIMVFAPGEARSFTMRVTLVD